MLRQAINSKKTQILIFSYLKTDFSLTIQNSVISKIIERIVKSNLIDYHYLTFNKLLVQLRKTR